MKSVIFGDNIFRRESNTCSKNMEGKEQEEKT